MVLELRCVRCHLFRIQIMSLSSSAASASQIMFQWLVVHKYIESSVWIIVPIQWERLVNYILLVHSYVFLGRLSILLRVPGVSGSNHGRRQIFYFFLRFSSITTSKCRNSTLNWGIPSSFHVPSSSLFILSLEVLKKSLSKPRIHCSCWQWYAG